MREVDTLVSITCCTENHFHFSILQVRVNWWELGSAAIVHVVGHKRESSLTGVQCSLHSGSFRAAVPGFHQAYPEEDGPRAETDLGGLLKPAPPLFCCCCR